MPCVFIHFLNSIITIFTHKYILSLNFVIVKYSVCLGYTYSNTRLWVLNAPSHKILDQIFIECEEFSLCELNVTYLMEYANLTEENTLHNMLDLATCAIHCSAWIFIIKTYIFFWVFCSTMPPSFRLETPQQSPL